METTLHRELKSRYAAADSQLEVRLGRYRIDVVRGSELIEIQHGSLAAIGNKVRELVRQHRVRVVKPIVFRKHLVKRSGRGRRVVDRRLSPKRGSILDLFQDMIYFCRVFPHRNLTLEVPLVTIEEWRYPGHGRRRWRRSGDHLVEDQKLLSVEQVHEFRTSADLLALLPQPLTSPFSTQQLAERLDVDRWLAGQIAYTLRETGAIRQVGKHGNWLLYQASGPEDP
jgi:hypothetical protein